MSSKSVSGVICGFLIGFCVSFFLLRGNFDYDPFYEFSKQVVNGNEVFNTIENTGISGYAFYDVNKSQAIFILKNTGMKPHDFNNAKFKLFLLNGKSFFLEPTDYVISDFPEKSKIFNPGVSAQIICSLPNSALPFLKKDKVKGFMVFFDNDIKIRIGYKKITLIRKIFNTLKKHGLSL